MWKWVRRISGYSSSSASSAIFWQPNAHINQNIKKQNQPKNSQQSKISQGARGWNFHFIDYWLLSSAEIFILIERLDCCAKCMSYECSLRKHKARLLLMWLLQTLPGSGSRLQVNEGVDMQHWHTSDNCISACSHYSEGCCKEQLTCCWSAAWLTSPLATKEMQIGLTQYLCQGLNGISVSQKLCVISSWLLWIHFESEGL